jgi:GNAT superfamily N-acetyltransferase
VTAALEVRTATRSDLPELQRVFAAAALSNVDDAPELLAHPEHLVFDGVDLDAGMTRVVVDADDPNHVLGFATVDLGEVGSPELVDLFVDPETRRLGIGRRLVADAVDTARAAGGRHIWVTGNEHALAFYSAVGFVVVGLAPTELRPAPRLRLDIGSDD